MKVYQTIIIALCVFLIIGCREAQPTQSTQPTQPTPKQQPQRPQATSPTEVVTILIEASKDKDVEAIKKLLSTDSLNLLDEKAKERKSTVEETLKRSNGILFLELPEMQNEKIEGDTATLEVKPKQASRWATLPFVREEGIWRVALDKYMENVIKMSESPANTQFKPNASSSNQAGKPGESDDKTGKSNK